MTTLISKAIRFMDTLPPRKFWDTSRCPQCNQPFKSVAEKNTETGEIEALAYCAHGPCTEIDEAAAHLLNCGATGVTFKEACDKLHKQWEEFTEKQ